MRNGLTVKPPCAPTAGQAERACLAMQGMPSSLPFCFSGTAGGQTLRARCPGGERQALLPRGRLRTQSSGWWTGDAVYYRGHQGLRGGSWGAPCALGEAACQPAPQNAGAVRRRVGLRPGCCTPSTPVSPDFWRLLPETSVCGLPCETSTGTVLASFPNGLSCSQAAPQTSPHPKRVWS